MKRVLAFAAFPLGVFALSVAVWLYSATQSLQQVQRRGSSELALASDRLVSALFSYRQLAVALASDPRLSAPETDPDALSRILLYASDISGALDFVLLDNRRGLISSASGSDAKEWRDRAFVRRALHGALGRDVGVSERYDRRVFYYAAPVFDPAGPVSRIIVAIIDLEAIEAELRGAWSAVFVSDASGLIYFTNRSELVLRDRDTADAAEADSEPVQPFVDVRPFDFFGFDIWSVSAGRYLPRLALHLRQDLPVIGMQAESLVDLRPALAAAGFQATAAGAVFLLFGLVFYVVSHQRRILARANADLEKRVGERTRDLSRANASLRVEIAERREAESALKRAQQDLVQAGKLGALGKMSAGVSHELNQPLMAIQSFADNAATYLDRGDADKARRNVEKVADLARRMARIIRNFRAFARQEKETVHRVDLVQAVGGAIDLAANRLERHGVALHLDLPDGAAWVQGGEVRLQQVVLNLLSNAVDAMAQSERREIFVSIAPGNPTTLAVRDTGPGIEEPEKVFEPFYTTRQIGEAEGMGLGLSISYGLVQSFGGKIRGQNDPAGGALFTVELQPWVEKAAA